MTDYKNKIEAILFASGRFMDANTLLNLTGASSKKVLENNIQRLKEEYKERDSPILLVEEKDGWKLTVRETYLPLVRNIVSEMELPKTVLETMAVIAWKSPVLQSDVVNIRHNKAYDHIGLLEELGFIRKEPEGRSYRLNLTEKFFEYFDVEGTRDIREVFNKVVGSPDQLKVDDFMSQDLIKNISGAQLPEKEGDLEFEKTDDDEFDEIEAPQTEEDEEFDELEVPKEQEEDEEFSELEEASDKKPGADEVDGSEEDDFDKLEPPEEDSDKEFTEL